MTKSLLINTKCYEKIYFKNPYWKIYPQTFDSNMLLAVSSSFQKASLRAFQFYDCYKYFFKHFPGFYLFSKIEKCQAING